jgi:hypothetical protein
MNKTKKNKKGIALVTAIIFGTIVLIVVGTVFLRLTFASKQVSLRDQFDQQNSLTDATLSNIIDWMNKQNYSSVSNPPNINTYKNAISFVSEIYTANTTNSNFQLNANTTPTQGAPNMSVVAAASPYIDSALPAYSLFPYDYTKNTYLNNFMTSTNRISDVIGSNGVKSLSPTPAPGQTAAPINWNPIQLSEKLYREFSVKNNKMSLAVRVSIIPLTTNITNKSEVDLHGGNANLVAKNAKLVFDHVDIYKIMAISCVPDCGATTVKIKRKYELIVQRPVITTSGLSFDQAVFANGTINLSNAKTNSGANYVDNTNTGDVFSNDNIAIGPNGTIGGKIDSAKLVYFGNPNTVPPDTSYNNVIPETGISPCNNPPQSTDNPLCTTTQIGGTDNTSPNFTSTNNKANSRSNVPPIAPPQVNLGPMPTTECNTSLAILKDCVISTDYTQNKTQEFQGTVYFKGSYTQRGDFLATGATPVHIVVDGKIVIGGNSKLSTAPNTQEVIFVSNYESPIDTEPSSDPAIKIAGNPGTGTNVGAVFYTSKPRSDVQIRGNAQVFGAVIANGSVQFDGSMTMKRDTDLAALSASLFPSEEKCKMQIVSWQEIKN